MKLRLDVFQGVALLCCCVFILTAGGCSKKSAIDRVVVSGSVTYQGQPISLGQIRFLPDANTQAPMSGAFISDGRYVVDAKGGVPVGTHRVEILAFQTEVSRGAGPDIKVQGGSREQYLPEKYNSASGLVLSVGPGQSSPMSHDFNLE